MRLECCGFRRLFRRCETSSCFEQPIGHARFAAAPTRRHGTSQRLSQIGAKPILTFDFHVEQGTNQPTIVPTTRMAAAVGSSYFQKTLGRPELGPATRRQTSSSTKCKWPKEVIPDNIFALCPSRLPAHVVFSCKKSFYDMWCAASKTGLLALCRFYSLSYIDKSSPLCRCCLRSERQ